MSTLRWATELLDTITDALGTEVDGVPVTVTPDLAEAPAALTAGHLVATVRPPTVDLPTWDEATCTWEVLLIAGPKADALTAWGRLDAGLMGLLEPLAVEQVTPDTFRDNQGGLYPVFTLTVTTHRTRNR